MEGDSPFGFGLSLDFWISIHALRVEGDSTVWSLLTMSLVFLSTPSGWRATTAPFNMLLNHYISIHALRVEGDFRDLENVQGLY